MIPAPFEYLRARSVEEAVTALAEYGEDAKLLAGGHSLLPLMKLRLAAPGVVVDLAGVDELRGVERSDGALVVGALTTHHDVIADPLIAAHCGVLAEVAATIGDAQVRHRGTIGGALAHGDAAGDLPAAVVAVDATLVAQGPDGRREIPASEFVRGYLDTALADDEVLVSVRVPVLDGWRWHYEKLAAIAQAWAIVGALAMVRTDGTRVDDARVALTNMASVPVRAQGVEAELRGATLQARGPREPVLDDDVLAAAAARAAEGTDPPSDLHASPDYRTHLAGTLTRRSLEACLR